MKFPSQNKLVLFTRVFSLAECCINSTDLAAPELQFPNFSHLAVTRSQSHLKGVQEWKAISITIKGQGRCGEITDVNSHMSLE